LTNGRAYDKRAIYQIRVQGHLDLKWSDWFDGWTITARGDEETLLSGPVVDQAALHGLIQKIADLGLPLISVKRIRYERSTSSGEPS
jgi:hypothetical protein